MKYILVQFKLLKTQREHIKDDSEVAFIEAQFGTILHVREDVKEQKVSTTLIESEVFADRARLNPWR